MKKVQLLIILFTICLLLIFSKNVSLITTNVMQNFIINIIPTLAPIMILVNIFTYSGGFLALFNSNKLSSQAKHLINTLGIIVIGVLSGTPALANILKEEKNKSFSKEENDLIMSSFVMPSFPFLLAIAINSDWVINKKILLFVPLIINIFLFLLSYKKEFLNYEVLKQNTNIDNIMSKAIITTAQSLILMLGTIALFSLLGEFISYKCPSPYKFLLHGLIEFSYPLNILLKSNILINLYFAVLIIAFSSLSLIIQVKLLYKDISIIEVIKKRLIVTALSILFILFLAF